MTMSASMFFGHVRVPEPPARCSVTPGAQHQRAPGHHHLATFSLQFWIVPQFFHFCLKFVSTLSQRGHFCLNFVSGTTFFSQLCLNFVSARTFLSQLCLSEDICVSTLSQFCLNFVSARTFLSQLCLSEDIFFSTLSQLCLKIGLNRVGGGFGPSQQVLVFLYFFFILYYKIIQKFTKCVQWGLNTGCVYLSYASTLKRWDPLATYVLATHALSFFFFSGRDLKIECTFSLQPLSGDASNVSPCPCPAPT